jgi:hypothetical protein
MIRVYVAQYKLKKHPDQIKGGCRLVSLGSIPEKRKALKILTDALADTTPNTPLQPMSGAGRKAYSKSR